MKVLSTNERLLTKDQWQAEFNATKRAKREKIDMIGGYFAMSPLVALLIYVVFRIIKGSL